jgi:hypothetical protein
MLNPHHLLVKASVAKGQASFQDAARKGRGRGDGDGVPLWQGDNWLQREQCGIMGWNGITLWKTNIAMEIDH